MPPTSTRQRLADYLTVGEAAEFLGVSPWTLRNWDKAGKLKPRRHPKNGYRIYRHEDLAAVLEAGHSGVAQGGAKVELTPGVDWGEIGPREHFVQFYETDAFLIESVGGFVGSALNAGDAGIVIATESHREGIIAKLKAQGVDVDAAVGDGRFVAPDAAETLAKFMVDGSPDPQKFAETVGEVVARLTAGGRRLRAFGEMVALLWATGNKAGAIRLEELWNELGKSRQFALFCAYPMNGVAGAGNGEAFGGVCSCHTRVIPAESYAALPSGRERLVEVARLQQKARSLEAEIEHRGAVEKALARRERELSDFFENATEGLHRVGADGTILWANKAELDLLGYAAEEYVGRHIAEFHADQAVIEDMLARLGRGECLINQPARLLHKDGSVRHVLVNSNACFEDGQFVCTRCFTRDVTALKLAEEERAARAAAELEASKAEARRRAAFLNAISHDLRTPLNGLVLQASLARLSADSGDGSTLDETLTQIESSVASTSDLLTALLEAARYGDASDQARPMTFDLREQLENVLGTCRAAAEAKGLALRLAMPPGLRVHTDRVKLERIVLNLLDNAIKFTERGSASIDVRQAGRDVLVEVIDTGVGVPPEHAARLFDEFYQVGNPERDRRKGFGLGLAVARRLAVQLGGSLSVESEPGRGSRFTVSLPGVAGERVDGE